MDNNDYRPLYKPQNQAECLETVRLILANTKQKKNEQI